MVRLSGKIMGDGAGSRPLLATLLMVLERFSLFPTGRREHDLHGRQSIKSSSKVMQLMLKHNTKQTSTGL